MSTVRCLSVGSASPAASQPVDEARGVGLGVPRIRRPTELHLSVAGNSRAGCGHLDSPDDLRDGPVLDDGHQLELVGLLGGESDRHRLLLRAQRSRRSIAGAAGGACGQRPAPLPRAGAGCTVRMSVDGGLMQGPDVVAVDVVQLRDAGAEVGRVVETLAANQGCVGMPSVGAAGLGAALAHFEDRWSDGAGRLRADLGSIAAELVTVADRWEQVEARAIGHVLPDAALALTGIGTGVVAASRTGKALEIAEVAESLAPAGTRAARLVSSSDAHVAEAADALERAFPGRVQAVSTQVLMANGLSREGDVDLGDLIVQVKSGNARGLTGQREATTATTGRPTIGYAPDIPNPAWEAATRQRIPLARTPDELIGIVKELGR